MLSVLRTGDMRDYSIRIIRLARLSIDHGGQSLMSHPCRAPGSLGPVQCSVTAQVSWPVRWQRSPSLDGQAVVEVNQIGQWDVDMDDIVNVALDEPA
jgi:hypothetical protein